MPTPFYHLQVAESILRRPDLKQATRRFLLQYRFAFLFGNTAPDVQVMTRQEREATHFFDLPIPTSAAFPWERMLQSYPSLSLSSPLPAQQAAFLAGYLCHLQADWWWVKEIFAPVFGLKGGWGDLDLRLYMHNVLRAYLDRQVLQRLALDVGPGLETVAPQHWLPFIEDAFLYHWRDFLAAQLKPGAAAQTVEVFATRQGIPPEHYYRLLDSEDLMEQEVFIHLPRQRLEAYWTHLLAENVQLLNRCVGRVSIGVYRQIATGVTNP